MSLSALFNPQSIAVVGASPKPSVGRAILGSLGRMGYAGPVWPINPRYAEVQGFACRPDLADLPGPLDAAAFCIGNARLPENFRAAIDAGMRAAVIYSGGFSEHPSDEAQALSREIAGLAREAGVALLGPNCMGILNAANNSALYMHEVFDPARARGNVGFMSQSGAMCISMVSDCRRYGFSHVISSGNEEVVSSCDLLEAMIDDPGTRVIGCFTESVKEPERYVALLDRAADLGKPVVVLKAGKSARAVQAVVSHTGGLAGDSAVFSAVLRAHRAIEVDDLAEMAEVIALCQGSKWPEGNRLGVVTGSGGQTELLLDISERTAISLPVLEARDRQKVEAVVGHVPGEGNPLDAWGNGNPNENYPHALRVLGNSDGYDIVAFVCDGMDGHPLDDPAEDLLYAHMVAEAQPETAKPLALLSTRAGVFRSDQEAVLRAAGVPMLSGARLAMQAIARMADWSAKRAAARPLPEGGTIAIDRDRPSINEFDAKALLARAGVPVVAEALVPGPDAAAEAAARIGFPVVVKIVSDDIPHKSDLGLVALDLASAEAVAEAVRAMQARVAGLSPAPSVRGYVVQRMVRGGVEMLAGVKHDASFGPMLALSLGGVLVDLSQEVALRPLPLAEGEAEAMIAALPTASRLLEGVRGAPPADRAALIACLEAISDFVLRGQGAIAEMDINPIKVLPEGQGAIVVDAVIVPQPEA
ncbi:acetate--CoA ligase family protein [Pseudogemmobacter sonorensis]|uniref:acetate--CoA ligase family protein n=1 Tax=Pseudogemmobacter sonorensis TaxID=2989681 RepID=UPI003683B057